MLFTTVCRYLPDLSPSIYMYMHSVYLEVIARVSDL